MIKLLGAKCHICNFQVFCNIDRYRQFLNMLLNVNGGFMGVHCTFLSTFLHKLE